MQFRSAQIRSTAASYSYVTTSSHEYTRVGCCEFHTVVSFFPGSLLTKKKSPCSATRLVK